MNIVALKKRLVDYRIVWHIYFFSRMVFKRKRLAAEAKKKLEEFGCSFADEKERAARISDMVRMYGLHGFGLTNTFIFDWLKGR